MKNGLKAKQGLMEIKNLRPKRRKWEMRIGWKAKHGLTLKWDFKIPKVVFGSSFVDQTRF